MLIRSTLIPLFAAAGLLRAGAAAATPTREVSSRLGDGEVRGEPASAAILRSRLLGVRGAGPGPGP